MASETNSFGTLADNSAAGTVAWSNPTNASSSDNTRTTASLVGLDITHYLDATNGGWDIPENATIDGIELHVERSVVPGAGEVQDLEIRIQRFGSVFGSNKATATAWPTSDTVATYGSPSDLWGTTWVPSSIMDSSFGFLISAQETLGEAMTALIDHVEATVYWTPGVGSLNQQSQSRRVRALRRI